MLLTLEAAKDPSLVSAYSHEYFSGLTMVAFPIFPSFFLVYIPRMREYINIYIKVNHRNICTHITSNRLHQIRLLFFLYVSYYWEKVCIEEKESIK